MMEEHIDMEQHIDLACVIGGRAPVKNAPVKNTVALGRCGPADRWKILGDVHTPQCMAHDLKVRGLEDKGVPHWLAQLESADKLPAAIGSYIRAVV
jgi:hypothetical protein